MSQEEPGELDFQGSVLESLEPYIPATEGGGEEDQLILEADLPGECKNVSKEPLIKAPFSKSG